MLSFSLINVALVFLKCPGIATLKVKPSNIKLVFFSNSFSKSSIIIVISEKKFFGNRRFIGDKASINISEIDDEAKKFPIVQKVEKDINLNAIMSNSFGFGGTNATLVFEKV